MTKEQKKRNHEKRLIATAILIISLMYITTGCKTVDEGPEREVVQKPGQVPYMNRTSDGVAVGTDGRLVYVKDKKGNRLPDFSFVGYHHGEKVIPDVKVVETLSPVDGDNTQSIQQAIDRIGNLPLDKDGLRGALLLKRGIYPIDGSLSIRHSGIVLRGEGRGKGGTVLVAKGYEEPEHKRDIIVIGDDSSIVLADDSRTEITDDYVPIGTTTFSVKSIDGYKVGDRIVIYRPSTAAWIASLRMDRMAPKMKMRDGEMVNITKQWQPGSYDFTFENEITAIDGSRITVKVPTMHALEARYGGGAIYHYSRPGRISEIGVENLTLMSEFAKPTAAHPYGDPATSLKTGFRKPQNENHGWHAIYLNVNTEDTWVRDITANYFGRSLVTVRGNRATVQDCVSLGHVSTIMGGRRYTFEIEGQQNLVQRCVSLRGRHEYSTSSKTAGPNVFLDCLGIDCVAASGCGPHHRYSIGCLYDNIKSDSKMEATNYGNRGSGHGWGGAQIAFYNCVAPSFFVRAPLGNYCWVIGGRKPADPESKMAKPRSLYLTQLKERLGDTAHKRMTIEAQRTGAIYDVLKERLSEQKDKHE